MSDLMPPTWGTVRAQAALIDKLQAENARLKAQLKHATTPVRTATPVANGKRHGPLGLSTQQLHIITTLANNPAVAVSDASLWIGRPGSQSIDPSNVLKAQLSVIRRMLRAAGVPVKIKREWGFGYIMSTVDAMRVLAVLQPEQERAA